MSLLTWYTPLDWSFISVQFFVLNLDNWFGVLSNKLFLFWSVIHTSLTWNSELNVFKKIWPYGEISNRLPNGLFGTNVYKTLEFCW